VTPVFTPYMVNLFKNGKLDILKEMVKTYKPEQFEEALMDQHAGKTIKPVIVW
jgi:aryl-alcohol dehydrogenase